MRCARLTRHPRIRRLYIEGSGDCACGTVSSAADPSALTVNGRGGGECVHISVFCCGGAIPTCGDIFTDGTERLIVRVAERCGSGMSIEAERM